MKSGIKVKGYTGTWYVMEERDTPKHGKLLLLESEQWGDEAQGLIVKDETHELVMDYVWNGFGDYEEEMDRQEEEA